MAIFDQFLTRISCTCFNTFPTFYTRILIKFSVTEPSIITFQRTLVFASLPIESCITFTFEFISIIGVEAISCVITNILYTYINHFHRKIVVKE